MEQITTDLTGGKKADGDKVRFELLIPEFIESVARVMTFGAKKYGDWNYLLLQRERVIGALHRHVNAYQQGERDDPETGESHLIHATRCMMMLWGIDNEFHGKDLRMNFGINMHEHPKSNSSAGVAQNRWADLQVEIDNAEKQYPVSKSDLGQFLESLSKKEKKEFSEIYNNYHARVCSFGKATMTDELLGYFKRLDQFKKDRDNTLTDININTENVKIKGDLVALRYTGENLNEIEKHIDFEFSTWVDQPYFSRERWWNEGEWVVYSKQFACIQMLEIVSNETFESKLKHLFE